MTVARRTTTVVPITSLRLGHVTFFISELVSRKNSRVLVHHSRGRATIGFSDDIASIRILDLQQKTIRRAIHSLIATYFRFGRPRGTRTPNLRFWSPLRCQYRPLRVYSPTSLLDEPCACGRDGRTSSVRASPSWSFCSSSSSSSDACTRSTAT